MTASRLLDEYYLDIDSECVYAFPNRTGDDVCSKINGAVAEALFELGFKGLKLMNGPVNLDEEAYDPEYNQTTDRLYHTWIVSGGKRYDFADNVFHTEDGKSVSITEYDRDGEAEPIRAVYGDTKLKESVKKLLSSKIKR